MYQNGAYWIFGVESMGRKVNDWGLLLRVLIFFPKGKQIVTHRLITNFIKREISAYEHFIDDY
jgi:hypothetical protein